jgi:hypothetical protein
MQLIRPLFALGALLLAASCAPDAGQLTAPDQPLRSAGTRTYTLYALSWWYDYGTQTTQVFSSYNSGYIQVEQVSDADGSASQIAAVQSGTGPNTQSVTKPDGYSLRLTAVPTASRCKLWRWVLKTPSGSSTTLGGRTTPPNPINMDSYSQYSYARADFFCS